MDFLVNNEIELGNAIWSSRNADKIVLVSGKYGNIPLKTGVCYEFLNNSSASEILGLGIGFGESGKWKAGSVKIGEIEIKNPQIEKTNIKLYYVFQKLLPFNTRFENPISFVHANGVIINVLGNNKENFTLSSNSQLPKAIINIIVPVLDGFDIDKADKQFLVKIFSKNLSSDEKLSELELHQQELEKKNNVEKTNFNLSIGLQLNEMEYKGLWAINSFIREYCLITNEKKINGYSINEFKDELNFLITDNLSEEKPFYPSSIINYQNLKLEKIKEIELSNSLLNSKEYPISNFINFQLNQLNYSFATISMYQEFESLWEDFSPNLQDKWGFIEHYILEIDTKGKLGEMINARNNIIHNKKLLTKDNPPRNKLKKDWNSKELNEFEIYAYKKPFEWNTALKKLKNSIQHHV